MLSPNNQRIAKNSFFLYLRMIVVVIVSLLSTRFLLKEMGVNDYGIYTIVISSVGFVSFVSNSLMSSIQRFFAFDIGEGNYKGLQSNFSTSIFLFLIYSILIFIILESIRPWLLNSLLSFPQDRMNTVVLVYYICIISYVINIASIPDKALLIAKEKMKVFGVLNVLEVVLKLIAVLLLMILPEDNLIQYSILLLLVNIVITICYRIISSKINKEVRFTILFEKSTLINIVSYSGWSFIGATSYMLKTHGINILLNNFFGVIVNAAFSISQLINGVVNNFVNSITQSVNPQITKYYASRQYKNMFNLVFRSSKVITICLYIISFPIFLETNYILSFWLGDFPDYTINFTKLILIVSLSESLSNTLTTLASSTGNIKYYQIIVGGILLLNLPLSYLILKLEYPPVSIYFAFLVTSFIAFLARLIILKQLVNLSLRLYIKEVLVPTIIIIIISSILPIVLHTFLEESFFRLIIVSFTIFSIGLFSLVIFGFNITEREKVFRTVKNILRY